MVGSDEMPTTEVAVAANKAMWEMVEPYGGFERWLECMRRAVRLPASGDACRLAKRLCAFDECPRPLLRPRGLHRHHRDAVQHDGDCKDILRDKIRPA